MDSDLVSSSCLQLQGEVANSAKSLEYLVMGDCLASIVIAIWQYSLLLAVNRMTTYGIVYRTEIILKSTAYQSAVLALNAVVLQLLGEGGVGFVILCNNQKSRGILVNSVHNSRAHYASDTAERVATMVE